MGCWTVRKGAILLAAGLLLCLAARDAAATQPTFTATELLGSPTADSVTVNLIADSDLEIYFEFGTSPGLYTGQTPAATYPGGDPVEVVIDGLQPDTLYFYRTRYRLPGDPEYSQGEEHSFHTQRAAGSSFTFTIQTDSHQFNATGDEIALYEQTLFNIAADAPDFHISLGDEFEMVRVRNEAKARSRYLEQRPYLGRVAHSSPLFLVLGNHEDVEGWHRDGTPDNVAVWSANARKLYYPNPVPGDFYSGNISAAPFINDDGLPENFFSWEWGNAQFIVIDPFWYTTTDPDQSGDNWDWTLGAEQYDWLKKTLESSSCPFKFVFSHHLTGGSNPYGRGGAEAAPYFEWGGHNPDDSWGFSIERPGWAMPIHQLMVANGVDIFFHGHDHFFARQELDGIIYQEAPVPDDVTYGYGFLEHGSGYVTGDILPNSGHLRVTVAPSQVRVEYVRAYLPGDGTNGETAFTYTIEGNYDGSLPPVADGKHAGPPALFAVNGTDPDQIEVTYSTAPCSAAKAVILYGNIGDYSGYSGSALDDAGNSGAALFDTTGLDNIWFNILWTEESTAGHPGHAFAGGIDAERIWTAAGLAGLTEDDHSDNSCD